MNIKPILFAVLVAGMPVTLMAQPMVHPGLLHTRADLDRMRGMVTAGTQPYLEGWSRLSRDSHASLNYAPQPFATVTRTSGGAGNGHAEMVNDAIAGYLHAVAWQVTGNPAHARKAVQILNAWSGTLTAITGDGDRYLAAGLTAYHFANAGEILRAGFSEWSPVEIEKLRAMLLTRFYPLSHDFLVRHNGSRIDHYFANWDAANMLGIMAIGVFCDNRAMYLEASDYFKTGRGNGCIMRAVWDGETGQLQESGRDQPHAQLSIGLLATLCEIAWNQGEDLYGYAGNRLLKGFEYTGEYLLGGTVPFRTYSDSSRTFTVIAPRGTEIRPMYEMVWNHYQNRRGLPAPFTRKMAESIRPEGFHRDHPGFGTILFSRPFSPSAGLAGEAGRLATPRGGSANLQIGPGSPRLLRVKAPVGTGSVLLLSDMRGTSRLPPVSPAGGFYHVDLSGMVPGGYVIQIRTIAEGALQP